jgi:hypothetical protein
MIESVSPSIAFHTSIAYVAKRSSRCVPPVSPDGRHISVCFLGAPSAFLRGCEFLGRLARIILLDMRDLPE